MQIASTHAAIGAMRSSFIGCQSYCLDISRRGSMRAGSGIFSAFSRCSTSRSPLFSRRWSFFINFSTSVIFFLGFDLVDFILFWLNLCHKVACQVGIRAGYGLPGAKARARQRDKFTPFYLRLNLLFAFCTLKLACRFMP